MKHRLHAHSEYRVYQQTRGAAVTPARDVELGVAHAMSSLRIGSVRSSFTDILRLAVNDRWFRIQRSSAHVKRTEGHHSRSPVPGRRTTHNAYTMLPEGDDSPSQAGQAVEAIMISETRRRSLVPLAIPHEPQGQGNVYYVCYEHSNRSCTILLACLYLMHVVSPFYLTVRVSYLSKILYRFIATKLID